LKIGNAITEVFMEQLRKTHNEAVLVKIFVLVSGIAGRIVEADRKE
jgi:hypothetical protein